MKFPVGSDSVSQNFQYCFLTILLFRVCVSSSMRQWARREAERLIQQREKAMLPLLEENYYDPSKISQPAAEES